MKQSDLDREIARATDETVECISRRGFSLIVMPPPQPIAQSPLSDKRSRPGPKEEPRRRPIR